MARPRYPGLLTPAEQRVLDEIRLAKTNTEIAIALGVSPNTVKYHVANLLAKLELRDRQELASWNGRTHRPPRWAGIVLLKAAAGVASHGSRSRGCAGAGSHGRCQCRR